MNPPAQLAELKHRLRDVEDLISANAVLGWDEATYMPPGGAEARGRQSALLSRLAHERFTDPAVGGLLDDLAPWAAALAPDSVDAALVRVTRRDYERATKVPTAFVQRMAEHASASYHAWQKARPADDFAAVRPFLETTVELSREYASYFPGFSHPFDPLIDAVEEGMTVEGARALFATLRPALVDLIGAIGERPPIDDGCLSGTFDVDAQRAFGEDVVRAFGYDFERGRQDTTAHPFMTKLGRGDVRITTRFRADDVADGLFSTLHEAGHAMYEQGVDDGLDGTPLFGGATSGVHESQSRLWENIVGRSLPFWRHYYPRLQAAFPAAFGDVDVSTFHRAINKVAPSLIRVDADEVTYNLHVMLRFDFELALLEGSLAVADLPDAWRERMAADLGVAVPDDRRGALQDVHWYAGQVGGAFQSYTLGNVMSAQIYAAAERALPDLDDQIAAGMFGPLRAWLTSHIYRHGRMFTAPELIARATGAPLGVESYLAYLHTKYGALYGL